jgi:hypothetical protein
MTEQDLIKFKGLSMQDGRLNLQWFAEYVAEAEREECARIAENRFLDKASCTAEEIYEIQKKSIAADIRARGES